MNKKTFIITGANFANKGAQSMLLITITELRKRYKDCKVFVDMPDEPNVPAKFQYGKVSISMWQYAIGGKKAYTARVKTLIKKVIGRNESIKDLRRFKNLLRTATALIDISGFSLTSQWDIDISTRYLDMIEAAKANNLPVFLMPQSFGPFEYADSKERIINRIKNELKYPKIIFARESKGYEELCSTFRLTNVKKSCDLVLQSKVTDYSLAVETNGRNKILTIPQNSVAILPNLRAFQKDDGKQLEVLYIKMINTLLDNEKKVFIMRHSVEDLEPCQKIYSHFENNNNVCLVKDDLSSSEYNEIVREFDFIIASRYHSIIHAYKNHTPALVLGWAEKYHELVKLFKQDKYIFDVREHIDSERIIGAIKELCQNCEAERYTLNNLLPLYQSENCFDLVERTLD